MEKLVDSGKAKHIGKDHLHSLRSDQVTDNVLGISNFSSPKVKRLLKSARIKPAVHQIECHPHWPQKSLVRLCQENGIHVTAFGPLGCVPIPALQGRKGLGPLEDETASFAHDSRYLFTSFTDDDNLDHRTGREIFPNSCANHTMPPSLPRNLRDPKE